MSARQEIMLDKFKKQQEEEKVIKAAYETKLANTSVGNHFIFVFWPSLIIIHHKTITIIIIFTIHYVFLILKM